MRARAASRALLPDERGAVFVQVGIAAFVLVSFSVFVLDYGMMWVSRRQAQNAADAGALAAAVSRGYDDFDPTPSPHGPSGQVASAVAAANPIWQQAGTSQVAFDCPAGVTGDCVTVNVYRNGTNGSTPLPTLFGGMLGVTNHGVLATATAVSAFGGAVNCLRPFAFPNLWQENGSSSHPTNRPDQFNRWVESGPGAGTTLISDPDVFVPPSATSRTGYDEGDYAHRLAWEWDAPLMNPITEGLMLRLHLPGSNSFFQNVTSCYSQPVQLGQVLSVSEPSAGLMQAAMENLFAQDEHANWNYGESIVENSCAPGCAAISPRLIAVALFDPDEFQRARATGWSTCPGGDPCIRVSNIVGFFVHRLDGSGLPRHGHMVRYPGVLVPGAPTFAREVSWLRTSYLVR